MRFQGRERFLTKTDEEMPLLILLQLMKPGLPERSGYLDHFGSKQLASAYVTICSKPHTLWQNRTPAETGIASHKYLAHCKLSTYPEGQGLAARLHHFMVNSLLFVCGLALS